MTNKPKPTLEDHIRIEVQTEDGLWHEYDRFRSRGRGYAWLVAKRLMDQFGVPCVRGVMCTANVEVILPANDLRPVRHTRTPAWKPAASVIHTPSDRPWTIQYQIAQ